MTKPAVLPLNLLQSNFWGKFKSEFGWSSRTLDTDFGPVLILDRKLKGPISLSYIPHPFSNLTQEEQIVALRTLSQQLQKEKTSSLFYRFDLLLEKSDPAFDSPISRVKLLTKSAVDIQPPDTVIIDLTKSDEELLSAMKSKTRYNIRLSQKKGVTVREAGINEYDLWYDMYKITAQRDKIALHGQDYYYRLFTLAENERQNGRAAPKLKLIFAEHDGELLAGIVVSIWQNQATYLYGASTNHKRNLMPAYGLQWAAMKLSRQFGAQSYDMFGIPPTDDPEHPMYGLYRFKTGFGGTIVHRVGCWDLPVQKVLYKTYLRVENIRNWYYKKIRKR